jgi:hypothetical protein
LVVRQAEAIAREEHLAQRLFGALGLESDQIMQVRARPSTPYGAA